MMRAARRSVAQGRAPAIRRNVATASAPPARRTRTPPPARRVRPTATTARVIAATARARVRTRTSSTTPSVATTALRAPTTCATRTRGRSRPACTGRTTHAATSTRTPAPSTAAIRRARRWSPAVRSAGFKAAGTGCDDHNRCTQGDKCALTEGTATCRAVGGKSRDRGRRLRRQSLHIRGLLQRDRRRPACPARV
jgi:hypothetical protein